MRELFVTELVKELLGPRGGIDEVLQENPLSEYVTGVLAPPGRLVDRTIDSEAELPLEGEGSDAEDNDADAHIVAPDIAAPALNPKDRPRSIGISFLVEHAASDPVLELCVTWARYAHNGHGWARQARCAVVSGFTAHSNVVGLDATGRIVSAGQGELVLHCVSRPRGSHRFVSLYLVNSLLVPQDDYARPEYHIYQPQIRVNAGEGTRIVPSISSGSDSHSDDEVRLSFLYRDTPIMARGHLCSTIWRDIDPEREYNGDIDFVTTRQEPPFFWIDGQQLPAATRQQFSPPDLRSEFIPLHPIGAPDLSWPSGFGSAPELHADRLAEMGDSASLDRSLAPLVDGYRRWIADQAEHVSALPLSQQPLGRRLVGECTMVADRMQAGINLLVNNPDARLAFCFSMKAMALQASWPLRQGDARLQWHPFQLAFMLMALESIVLGQSADRDVCDLLWVATGGGKTEAYLALAAFTIAYRRRRSFSGHVPDQSGAGTSVISRYTLRLLTIQQFRRTLKVVTACEVLRNAGLGSSAPVGWRPPSSGRSEDFLWGSSRFSAGLWVGGGVTPNRLLKHWASDRMMPGAIDILRGTEGEGEPAQIVNCPACEAVLSVPRRSDGGLPPGTHVLSIVVTGMAGTQLVAARLGHGALTVTSAAFLPRGGRYSTLQVEIASTQRIAAEDVDAWWSHVQSVLGNIECASARPSRPGYFIRWYQGQNQPRLYDFDLYCPNTNCPLEQPWCEGLPSGRIYSTGPRAAAPRGDVSGIPPLSDGNRLGAVIDPFRGGSDYLSTKVPIPALTVDEQVYYRCPTLLIATVDKFARPVFEPRAAALFGNVDHHHCIWGYYREGDQHPEDSRSGHPTPLGSARNRNYTRIPLLAPPDLILQDELHLIEGPLGSLVGLYETAVDQLSQDDLGHPVKYIASTATVRQAKEQVQCLFSRRLVTFPPPGLTAHDSFFVRSSAPHQLDDRQPGRLYLGISAPGRGPLTPLVRIWTRLLQAAYEQQGHPRIDPFWTLTGYFNAVRELAGARALYRQDIPERLRSIGAAAARPIPDDDAQELSGRTASTELPAILDLLGRKLPNAQDSLFTTSMFGTGVDVPRLGLMVVNGQPKTTSSYIQATGRVGRSQGALVVVFLRASRPRDLDHYEFFSGYHAQLHRFVEPITVMPFAPGALERGCGPVEVFLLRCSRGTSVGWHEGRAAAAMGRVRSTAPEVVALPQLLELRSRQQSGARAPQIGAVQNRAAICLDRWQQAARRYGATLNYVEYSDPPLRPVVLGDPRHLHAGLEAVFRNAPQSLRDIEETCGFQT